MDWHQCDQCPLPTKLHSGDALWQAGNSWKAGYLLLHLWQGIPDSAAALGQFFILENFIFQILNLSPPPPQVNLTAKSLHHFHADFISLHLQQLQSCRKPDKKTAARHKPLSQANKL